ncbi:MAG TPA: VPA1262 family N-terminal domain-containing protein [Allosphingosinicella sp.]|jgi:hypothetical protein
MPDLGLDYAQADYCGAAIRLATVVEDKVQRLLFACVELYPNEISVPPKTGEQRHSGTLTLRHSITPASVAEAFLWYEQAASGVPGVPGMPNIRLAPATLAPEPGWGRWLVGADPPFEPRWHGGARLHRLVNMVEPAESVGRLGSPGDNRERWEANRSWLAERLHFDLLASDDWIGSCALLAPNPVARGLTQRLLERSPTGSETFRLAADLRDGASPAGLTIRAVERRGGGLAQVSTHALDRFGSVEIRFPQPVDRLGYELHCDQRGLLASCPPAPLLRQILTNMSLRRGELQIDVPSPRKSGAPARYSRPIVEPVDTDVIGNAAESPALKRLRLLIERRERRTGSARPGGEHGGSDMLLFDCDREAATAAIRQLIGRARRTVTLVDPYFDELVLPEFALAAPSTNIEIRVLTNYQAKRRDLDSAMVPMERLYLALRDAADLLARHRLGKLDVRVTGGKVRRYHDRFLIVDEEAWHCGHSFNQVGRIELSAMTRLRRPEAVIAMIEDDFMSAEPFSDAHLRWLANEPLPLPRWRVKAARLVRSVSQWLEQRS